MLDTGPLVSFLADGLAHHAWAVEQWKQLRPPLLTCEPVLTEAAFLLKREGRDADVVFELLERRIIRIGLSVKDEQADRLAMVSVLTWGPAAPDVASTSSVFWMTLMSVSRDSDRNTRPTSIAIFSGGSTAARSSPVMHSPAASADVAALMAFARPWGSSLFVTIRKRVVSAST